MWRSGPRPGADPAHHAVQELPVAGRLPLALHEAACLRHQTRVAERAFMLVERIS